MGSHPKFRGSTTVDILWARVLNLITDHFVIVTFECWVQFAKKEWVYFAVCKVTHCDSLTPRLPGQW